jgi:branched-chain amino acid transport system permease protein
MTRRRGGSRLYRGVFWLLEGIGLKNARARWESQSPFIQRAVPPLVIAALVILVMLPFRTPDPAAMVLLAIVYALYIMPRAWRRWALPATILAFAIAYPLLIQQTNYQRFLFEVPIFNSFPSIDTMAVMAIFAMMAVGLNMVVGYAGLLDLGYVAFYALGAYTAAWLASPHASQFVLGGKPIDVNIGGIGVTPGLGGIHISIWVVLLAAAIVTAVGGILIGLPTLRLRGDYLAIVTLGFGEIIAEVARNGDSETLGFNLTGGPPGINPIDPPGFGVWLANHLGLPANYLEKSGQYVNFVSLFYWSAIVLLLITIFCSIRMRDSRLGRAWIAIREDEVAAAAMGIPLMRTKTWAYASGAFFGGVAGAWFGSFKQGVFPDDFYFGISIFILSMVILGGMGNVWGVVAGAALLTYLNQEGLSSMSAWFNDKVLPCDPSVQDPAKVISGGCVNAPLVATGIYGAIIVIVMLFRPEGLIPERRRQLEFETGVHDEPLMDVRHAPEEG